MSRQNAITAVIIAAKRWAAEHHVAGVVSPEAERELWGAVYRLHAIDQAQAGECESCYGAGRFDDIECPSCVGRGVR
jgi:hypothetical protein